MKHILTKQAERQGMIYIFSCMFLAGLFVALYCNRPMPPVKDFAVVHKIDTLHSELPDTIFNRIRYAKDY